jgi:hypothetical protein
VEQNKAAEQTIKAFCPFILKQFLNQSNKIGIGKRQCNQRDGQKKIQLEIEALEPLVYPIFQAFEFYRKLRNFFGKVKFGLLAEEFDC